MSTFNRLTKNLSTGKWEVATWIDDHFGRHKYGVKFPDGTIIDPEKQELETREIVDMPEKDIAQQASEIVNGDRQKDYDHPIRNFQRMADLWNGYLKARGFEVTLNSRDVAQMSVLLKMAREMYKHKEDNLTDIIGYTLCLDKIENFEG